ncbi:hypothetical protein PYW07_005341 [Mythimna separata]|uniref:Kazal-like domain-containing protein n=1 Tax=Mythimna separata TaxID=271217 RepID=A0AAD7YE61_MYTSE|nr:hypothetical protein PYW07_005341 [Mythimna separata]
MDLKLGIAIGTTLLLASAQPDTHHACTTYTDLSEPCGCAFTNETFDPVCGSDGLTYLNACFMECRNAVSHEYSMHIEVEYPGVCENEFQCQCHTEYKPVCGSNNVTYSNECTLQCSTAKDSRIQLKYEGPCGSQHEVLSEKDEHQCRAVRGKCQKRKNRRQLRDYTWETESRDNEFIRPSDENFPQPFPIEDHIINHSKEHEKPTPPTNQPKSRCLCAEVHRPVCGTNQRTYANFCVLFCGTKKNNVLEIDHWGECEKTDHDDGGNREEGEEVPQRKKCMCAAVHQPICANNNKTYPNLCVLHCESKKDNRIHFHRWGPCTV